MSEKATTREAIASKIRPSLCNLRHYNRSISTAEMVHYGVDRLECEENNYKQKNSIFFLFQVLFE